MLKNFLKQRLGVIVIFIAVLVGYVLLTDVFHVLNPFLFHSITTVPSRFKEYLPQLLEGLKSSMKLLVIAYSMALRCV